MPTAGSPAAPPFWQHPPQTAPDKFTPPPSFQTYPSFGYNQKQTIVNVYNPPWESGPGYSSNGGQTTSVINANPVSPIGQ